MVVSVLNKLESLKQLNLAKSKSSELQPDIKQQRKLILKNLAKNFVNNIINFQCEIVRDRIILDDRRVLKKSKKLKFDSPKSKTALVVDKKAPKSPEIIGFHEVDSDTSSQVVSESELKNLNNPKDAFHNIAKNFKDGKIYRIFRDSKGVEISVDQSEGFLRPEEVKGGKKRQGMSIIVDPTTMTGGSNVIISIRYEIPLTESSLPVVSTFNARRPEAAHHRLTSVVRSSSQVFGLQFTSTITQNRQHADKLSIPGWDGVPPIFVPFHTAYFELKEASGCPLTSISVLVLPSMGTRQLLKPLGHFYHKYSRLRVANSTYFGGIPCLHIACSNGNVEEAQSLMYQGADPNSRSSNNRNTALHEATLAGHADIVTCLIENGANQVLTNESGNTPLHVACQMGNIVIARILMKSSGGKRALQIQNKKGLRPIDLCSNRYLSGRVEEIMKAYMIIVKARVSVSERK